ncbi:MAG: hypothetical protein PHE48_00825 [Candidatus Daviesbacteria bacterium]|nr:hypothetical protein [Candidatus Daviesbacteria bacterium]
MNINFKRYSLYLFRWQLSTPILAPVVAYFKHSPSVFGTTEDWIGSAIANLIGGLIFFWVDKFIFTSKTLGAQWEVKENIECVDCGRISRGYRLAKTNNYDRLNTKTPQFRCEDCSRKKSAELKRKGIKL